MGADKNVFFNFTSQLISRYQVQFSPYILILNKQNSYLTELRLLVLL